MKCSNCRCVIPDSSRSCMYCGQPVRTGEERTEPVSYNTRRVRRRRNDSSRTYTAPVYNAAAETAPSYRDRIYCEQPYEQPYEQPAYRESAYRASYGNEPLYREGYYGSAVYRDQPYYGQNPSEQSYRVPSYTEQLRMSYRASEYNDSIYYAYNDGYYDDGYGYGGYVRDVNNEGRYGSDYRGRKKSGFDFSVICDDGSVDVAKCLLYFLGLVIAALIVLFILGLTLL